MIVSHANGEITTAEGRKGAVGLMIEHILYKDQIKELKQKGLWPREFNGQEMVKELERTMAHSLSTQDSDDEGASSSSSSSSELFVNRNRMGGYMSNSDSDSDSDSD